ncbi:MAG: translesion error-prone DNA polymerase V autoproteolytic subunit [bacterium]|jgi:DNA polymerase V
MKTKTVTSRKRRPGAGRKTGSTKYGEPTHVIRLPESLHRQALALLAARTAPQIGENIVEITGPAPNAPKSERPLFLSQVAAGFPSPADDHIEQRLDLNEYMIQHDAATYFVRVKGDSMIDAGIRDNDVLVVDRSVTARVGCIVVAVVNGELTVKTLGRSKSGQPRLVPANANYTAIEIKDGMSFEVWGVVTGSVRKFK